MEKVIKLVGRIDSTNSSEVEEKIIKDLESFEGKLILNLEELEYISSAGLRIILKLKKLNDNTEIINCNSEIFNIMEMTGFTDMMNVSKSFRNISIEGCPAIGKGANGIVYRYDPETIVKVFNKKNSLDMIKKERELAKKAFIKGIPTAISYDIVKVGDLYGAVFEMIDSKTFDQLISEGEDIEELVKKSAQLMKKFHSIKLPSGELPSKKEIQIQKAKFCLDYLPKEIGEKLIKLVEDIPETNTMLHGDCQIKNIMKQGDEILLIDMDSVALGHPIFEFGALYATYKGYSCVNKDDVYKFLGITTEQSNMILDLMFKLYFNDKDEKEIQEIKQRASILGYLQVLNSLIHKKEKGKIDNEGEKTIEFCRNYLADNIMKIDKLY